jgi:hypothetical protein
MPLLYLVDLLVSRTTTPLFLFLFLAIVSAAACDKVPLLAPTQSTINLIASTTTLPINGTAQVIATVIEQAGTPVQNGTTVTFTGSLGTFDPPEATTVNGKATTTFRAGGTSGTATIGAVSGGAKAEGVEIKIGGAAAETVTLRAEPATVPATGGEVRLVAVVTDASGNALVGAPVLFTTDNGQLGAASIVTNAFGEARTTLTTSRTSVVKARVGTKEGQVTINVTNLGVSITPPATPPVAGLQATFTITPTSTGGGAGSPGNVIRSVVVDWGDGTVPQNLGAISAATTVSHVYTRADTFTITATVTDNTGQSSSSSTSVTVQRAVVNVSFTNPPPTAQVGASVSFQVAVTNTNNVPIVRVVVSFGDGQSATLPASGGTASHVYSAAGSFTVTATATDQTGGTFTASHVIRIDPATAFNVTLDAQSGDTSFTLTCTPQTGYPKTCVTRFVGAGVRIVFTAGGTPPGFSSIIGYEWNFGDGSPVERTTSNSVDHVYRAPGDGYVITVTVFTTGGNTGFQRLTLIILPAGT